MTFFLYSSMTDMDFQSYVIPYLLVLITVCDLEVSVHCSIKHLPFLLLLTEAHFESK